MCEKYIEFGYPSITNKCRTSISIILVSTDNWKQAQIYDTVNEKIVCDIINQHNGEVYNINEIYCPLKETFHVEINGIDITSPTKEKHLYRYILKLIGSNDLQSNSNNYYTQCLTLF